ncbi:MAG: MFS transporter [Armatimonadota bacterium]|nr:MFS transporter [Armatimonadota bacterium]MDR7519103.1 MFS transporter [Armatimonadota bacterium]MDR7548968.1 MFS transporter [Armatimonadota bacterium]
MDSRAVWRIVAIVAMAQLGYATILPLLPLYLTERLGASVKLVGAVIATFALVETFFKTAWGGLADRLGRRPVMITGMLLSAAAPLVMAALRTPLLFVPLRLMDGMGSAALWPSAAAAVADVTTSERRATGMALLNLAFLGGIAAGPSLGLFVAGFAGDFRAGFYLASGLLLLAALLTVALIPADPPDDHAGSRGADGHPARRPSPGALAASVRASPALFALYLIAFAQMFGAGLLVPIAAIYAKQVVGLTEHAIGVLFLVITASVALATIPAGRVADRLGRGPLVIAGTVLGALGMWLIPFSRHLTWLAAGGILLGSSYALTMPAWLALVTERAPQGSLGLAVGASETVQGMGLVLGPLVGGLLWDALGPQAPFLASAAALSASALLAASALGRGDHG